MRVYWWQAGLHLEPESDQERTALLRLQEGLAGLGCRGLSGGGESHQVGPLPPVDSGHEEPVVRVEVAHEIGPDVVR